MKKFFNFSSVLLLYFLIVLVSHWNFFYLFKVPSILSGTNLYFFSVISGFVLSAICYLKYRFFNQRLYSSILIFNIVSSFSWLFLVLYSIIRYPAQSAIYSVTSHIFLLYSFLVIPLVSLFYCGKAKITLKIFSMLSLAWCVSLLFASFYYAKTGELPLNFSAYFEYSSYYSVRNFGIRISFGSLSAVGTIYSCKFVSEKNVLNKAFYLLSTAIHFLALVFVDQSRAILLITILACLFYVFIQIRTTQFKVAFFVFIVFALTIFGEHIVSLINSFIVESDTVANYSTYARLQSYGYYLSVFWQTGFIGNGFSNDIIYPYVQHGPDLMCYYSDVGIIGLIGKLGIFVIPFFLVPIFSLTKCIRRSSESAFIISVFVWLLLCFPFYLQVAHNFPLMLAFICSYSLFFAGEKRTVVQKNNNYREEFFLEATSLCNNPGIRENSFLH